MFQIGGDTSEDHRCSAVPHSDSGSICFQAFVEMKNSSDAQKLVDYYTSKTLRINDDAIRVSFSREYKSLM